ncbi:hypothetical protein [Cloacibacillus evryensis]|uniref:hypothetical protein n=1 Tax=Cloacibacillus evryensis TaxID=508460 RepID=UPI00210C4BEE|nr:hypothetical protein [Cloacibacillus evryensis]MCQ4765332.1 hypothetical protein [Cloacibacillus evryensis]
MEVCSLLDFILFGDDDREFDVVSIDIKLAVPLTEEQINRLGAFKRAGATLTKCRWNWWPPTAPTLWNVT